jgi:hypothetical protein
MEKMEYDPCTGEKIVGSITFNDCTTHEEMICVQLTKSKAQEIIGKLGKMIESAEEE